MSALKVTAIGNSLGVILPKEVVTLLRVQKGDHLHVLVTPRGIELSPFDPVLDEQLEVGRTVMKRYRSTLGSSLNDRRASRYPLSVAQGGGCPPP
jgi:putative addiction module antidote